MKTVHRFPEAATREPGSNSLSYRGLFVAGTGSILEIRENYIEVTNGTYTVFYPDRARLGLERRSCRKLAPAEPIARASPCSS